MVLIQCSKLSSFRCLYALKSTCKSCLVVTAFCRPASLLKTLLGLHKAHTASHKQSLLCLKFRTTIDHVNSRLKWSSMFSMCNPHFVFIFVVALNISFCCFLHLFVCFFQLCISVSDALWRGACPENHRNCHGRRPAPCAAATDVSLR